MRCCLVKLRKQVKVSVIVLAALVVLYTLNYTSYSEHENQPVLDYPRSEGRDINDTRLNAELTKVVEAPSIKLKENDMRPPTKLKPLDRAPGLKPKGTDIKGTLPQKELPLSMFRYPLDIDLTELMNNITRTGTTNIQPINVYPFSYSYSNEKTCDSTKDTYLLFLIKSTPGNFEQRQAIRETWANRTYFKEDIRHVFLLARTLNETTDERISLEKGRYNDIVQMTFIDAYFNNTYKTIGGINWCVKQCPTVKFVMMVDDDMFVATDNLLNYLHGLPNNITRDLFAGRVWYDHPQRILSGKWYMSVQEYPYKEYPPFASAGATIMSMDFLKKVQMVIPFTKRFKFDDVYIAIIAHRLGVKPIHIPEIKILKKITHADKEFKTVIAIHQYSNPKEMRKAWSQYLHMTK